MSYKYLRIALLIFAATPGCSNQPKRHNVTAPTEVAKVRVSVDGKVYFNERIVTLDELGTEFQRLKQIGGAVWLLDDSRAGEPRKLGRAVREAVIRAELPMKVQ